MKSSNELSRRNFIKKGGATALSLSATPYFIGAKYQEVKLVKIGVIGVGGRGTGLVKNLLEIKGVEIVAVCDIVRERAVNAMKLCQDKGMRKPEIYFGDEETYKQLLDKESLDAVIIATSWGSHTKISLDAMERNIRVGCELPIALTVDDTWALVEKFENSGVPCMMLENWSFRKDNLALLNMKRLGMFGDIVHCHCAHSHDVNYWYNEHEWTQKYLLKYNRDQYPCHSVGPILSWMDINCGDRFTEIYSIASASKGINAYYKREFGEDHPRAHLKYAQGDIVTSVLKTEMGKTLVINMDMQLPRPYSNRWLLQGMNGVYDEEKGGIYLHGISPEPHTWEEWKPYEEKYNHKWWEDMEEQGSHGGVDYVMLTQFIDAIRKDKPLPLDIYDSAAMTAIVELSGMSIQKNRPVSFPDFTRGDWKDRKPYFALDMMG